LAALILSGALGVGVLLFLVQAVSVALGRALRTYSRSRLEVVCASRHKPDLPRVIESQDEATERAAEGIAVVAELFAAAWFAREVYAATSALLALSLAAVLAVFVHFVASVVGRVWAETFLVTFWPIARMIRCLAWPLTAVAHWAEWLAYHSSGSTDAPTRPASVEVEILPDADHPEDTETDVSVSTRTLLEHVVGLTRLDVSEIMTPRSAITLLHSSVSAKQANPDLRGEPRRHPRNPLFQGPISAHGRPRQFP